MAISRSLVRATAWRHARRVLTSRVVTALTEPHGLDRYLRLVNPLWSTNDVYARVVAVARHTADTVTVTLRPNANWAGARAGQFVRLSVVVDGRYRTRCFSPAGSVDRPDRTVEITAKVNPDGIVTRWLAEHTRPGTVVRMSQAEGEFTLPDPPPEHVLLISGGSGITPVMSIARTLMARRYRGRLTFIHYARVPAAVVYREELLAMRRANPKFTLAFGYTRQPGRGELDGRFRGGHLRATVPGYPRAAAYACGPGSLLDAVGAFWAKEGIADRLRIERFGLAPYQRDGAHLAGEVRFTRSGIHVVGDGRTLLEQAESAGLRPDFGCRIGVCHTCSQVKSVGTVRDVRSGVTSAEPGERVQLCVTAPVGDVELAI